MAVHIEILGLFIGFSWIDLSSALDIDALRVEVWA